MTVKTILEYTDEWKQVPWTRFEKTLFRLQHRIYKSRLDNDLASVRRLQNLLLRSKSAKYLATRQVSQLNLGKKTTGVDGIQSLNPKERLLLVAELGDKFNSWKHQKLKRVFIPKADGRSRPLGIPTIKDRAMQCLLKYALEPVYEAIVSDRVLGFRPGHSTWDVQKFIYHNLNSSAKGYNKSIVELDIEKCFDNTDHDKLLSLIVLPSSGMKILRSALKAGVMSEFRISDEGTPEGGVISPLLSNIFLHGLEDLQNEKVTATKSLQRGFRYADDVVFILKEGESQTKLMSEVVEFLRCRGLHINDTKTKTVSAFEGFDFLGWHFVVKANNKFACYPSKESVKTITTKVKKLMKDTRYKLEDRILKVKTVYRGWFNYHQYCDMKMVNLWSINNWTSKYIIKSSNTKSSEANTLVKTIFSGHSSRAYKFATIKGSLSIYDNDWLSWSKRNSKRFKGPLLTTTSKQ